MPDTHHPGSALADTNLIDPSASTEEKVRYILDRMEIEQALISISSFDFEDWDTYTSVFDDDVRMDVAEQGEFWEGRIADFAKMIAPAFAAQDGTQHLTVPLKIGIDGDDATAKAYIRGYERRDDAPGGPEHRISAVYHLKLKRRVEGWKVHEMVKEVLWHDGNMGVLGDA